MGNLVSRPFNKGATDPTYSSEETRENDNKIWGDIAKDLLIEASSPSTISVSFSGAIMNGTEGFLQVNPTSFVIGDEVFARDIYIYWETDNILKESDLKILEIESGTAPTWSTDINAIYQTPMGAFLNVHAGIVDLTQIMPTYYVGFFEKTNVGNFVSERIWSYDIEGAGAPILVGSFVNLPPKNNYKYLVLTIASGADSPTYSTTTNVLIPLLAGTSFFRDSFVSNKLTNYPTNSLDLSCFSFKYEDTGLFTNEHCRYKVVNDSLAELYTSNGVIKNIRAIR